MVLSAGHSAIDTYKHADRMNCYIKRPSKSSNFRFVTPPGEHILEGGERPICILKIGTVRIKSIKPFNTVGMNANVLHCSLNKNGCRQECYKKDVVHIKNVNYNN